MEGISLASVRPDLELCICRETAAGLAGRLVLRSGPAITVLAAVHVAPAAALLRASPQLTAAGATALWLEVARALERVTRRHNWPARGFYVDCAPPAGIAALTAASGALWYIPFGSDIPWERASAQHTQPSAALPPPQVAHAAVKAWLALGAELPGTTAVDLAEPGGHIWQTQYAAAAAHASTASAVVAGRGGLGRGLRRMVGRTGYLLADGVPVMPRTAVSAGTVITAITPAQAGSSGIAAEIGPLSVLYEDDALLVVAKPPLVLLHPARGQAAGTLAGFVAAYLAARGCSPVVRPVGRLDRGTSGLVVFAKTRHAHAALAAQRARGQLGRTYIALSAPGRRLRGESFVLDGPVVSPPGDPGRYGRPRHALSQVRVLAAHAGGLALQVQLLTGRTHQIRQHLACAGIPLLGDTLYGDGYEPGLINRPALHAWRLCLMHPVSGAELRFHTPLPADMRAVLRWFRQGGSNDDQGNNAPDQDRCDTGAGEL